MSSKDSRDGWGEKMAVKCKLERKNRKMFTTASFVCVGRTQVACWKHCADGVVGFRQKKSLGNVEEKIMFRP